MIAHDAGPRQHRRSRARQRPHHRSALGDGLLCHRPWPHTRSVPQHRRAPDVGECRNEPVPSAGRRARCPARRDRAGGARSCRAARSDWRSCASRLEGTKFGFRESNDGVETVCPWGNRITVHAPDESRFGRIVLGMPYIAFDVRAGHGGAHRALLSRSHGGARDRDRERQRPQRACAGRREAVLVFPRDRRAGEAL